MTLAQVPITPTAWVRLPVPASLQLGGDFDSTGSNAAAVLQEESIVSGKSPVDLSLVQNAEMHRSLVRIESRFENKKTGYSVWKTGNGWMIRPDLVITSGDLVHDTEYQLGPATQVKCRVRVSSLSSLSGSQTELVYARRLITSSEWSDSTDGRSRDMALVQLAKPSSIDVCTYDDSFKDTKMPEPAPLVEVVSAAAPEVEKKLMHCAGCGGACGNTSSVPVETPVVEENKREEHVVATTDEVEAEEEAEDPFYTALATVSKIDTESLDVDSPLIGNVGQFVSIVGGTLLRYLVGAETIASCKSSKVPGAAERALLAEASLEAVLAIEESPALDEIVEKMKRNWDANAPVMDEAVAALLGPYLAEPASDILTFHEEDAAEQVDRLKKQHKRRALGIRHFTGTDQGSSSGSSSSSHDFVQGLFSPTFPLAGRESVFSSLGPVLRGAVQAVEQIVSQGGQGEISQRVPKLSQKLAAAGAHVISPISPQDLEATRILLQRAVMADAALQALSDLSKTTLMSLKLIPLTTSSLQIENVHDFIKAAVQRMGPTALLPAQHAAKKLSALLVDAPPVKTQVSRKPLETVKARQSGGKLALRDRLRVNKAAV